MGRRSSFLYDAQSSIAFEACNLYFGNIVDTRQSNLGIEFVTRDQFAAHIVFIVASIDHNGERGGYQPSAQYR